MNPSEIKIAPVIKQLHDRDQYESMSRIAKRVEEAKTGSEVLWLFLRRAVRQVGRVYLEEEIRAKCDEFAAAACARGCNRFLPRTSYSGNGIRIIFKNEVDFEYSRWISLERRSGKYHTTIALHEAESIAYSSCYAAGMTLMLSCLRKRPLASVQ